jgi:hypothetical protein
MKEITDTEYEYFQKLKYMFRSSYPERFEGQIFICGESHEYGPADNGFPERLHICRAYGTDIVKIYKRID